MVVLYRVYVKGCADKTGKTSISVPNVKGNSLDLKCEAASDEELTMFFEDYFWAKGREYYLADIGGVDEEVGTRIGEILDMPEDKRANKQRDHMDTVKEKLPKRRPRLYALYENGRRIL